MVNLNNSYSVHNIISTILQGIGEAVIDEARDTSLFHHSQSFDDANITYQTSPTTQTVENTKSFSGYLEYGNPYEGFIIRPVNAKALRFVINGKVIFSKSVRAHGPLPFLEQSRDKVIEDQERLNNIVQDALDKTLKG
jgi:hypothetical protein